MRRRTERAPLPAGFGTIWTAVALDLVGFGIVLPILPLYAEDFGASPTDIGLLVACYSVMQLVFSPLLGRLSDRVGRKPVILISLVGTAVGSLVLGLAGSLWVLFLGRIIDGASGASISVAQASVTDVAPPDQRARLLGLLSAAFGVGFVAGPALGGLASLGGPEVPFILAAVIAGINALVALRRLPETKPPTVAEAAASTDEQLPPVRTWSPLLVRLVVANFVAMVGFTAFEATFALLAEHRFDLGTAAVGGVFAAIGVVIVGVQGGLIHPVVAALGDDRALQAGLALNAVGLVLVALAESWLLLVPALLVLTVGQGLASPTLSSIVAGHAPTERRGAVLGVTQAAGSLARVVGPSLGGVLFQHVGIPAPYLLGAGFVALGLVLVTLRVDRADPVSPAAAARRR